MRNNIKLLLSRGKKLNFASDFKKQLPLHPEEFPPLKLELSLPDNAKLPGQKSDFGDDTSTETPPG